MEISVSKDDHLYVLDISIPKGKVDQEINDIAKRIKPQLKQNGFREGTVPLDVIKAQYRETILAEASTKMLYEAVSEALREHDIRNASNPELDEEFRPTKNKKFVGKLKMDGTMTYRVTIEPPPDIEVQDYKDLEVDVELQDFESWVKDEIFQKQMTFGDREEVERAAQEGDEITISFEGFIDDVPFEGGSDPYFTFILGKGSFVPGFEEGFIGKKPNEDFQVEITFPEDYPSVELQGKDAVFKCCILQVTEIQLHPLNDNLALMLSFESVDAMMDSYRETWETEFEKPMRAKIFNAIIDQVIESNPFKIPESWIEQEIKLTAQRIGLTEENLKQPAMVNSLRDVSERSVRVSFLLDKIYENEKEIHLSAEDIMKLAEVEAQAHGLDGSELLKKLKQANQYETFISYHEQQAAIEFLLNNSKLKESESG